MIKIELCYTGERFTKEDFLPYKAHKEDAGYDLFAAIDNTLTIMPHCTTLVPTGIKLSLPSGYEAQIRSRSGNALKKHLIVANSPGTIDCGYTGEVGVILYNTDSLVPIDINPHDKIAQMVIQKLPDVTLEVVDHIDTNTERGAGGFGSTGK